MKKIYMLILISLFAYRKDHAQSIQRVNLSLSPAYLKLLDSNKISNIGISLVISYTLNGKDNTFLSAKYSSFFSKKFDSYTTAYDNNLNSEVQADLNCQAKYFQFSFGIQRYFLGGPQHDFSVYGNLQYNFLIGSYTYNLKTQNTNLDYYSFVDGSKEKLSGKGFSFGAGCEKKINFCYIFGDLTYNLNFNNSVSKVITNYKIPSNLIILIGIKVPVF